MKKLPNKTLRPELPNAITTHEIIVGNIGAVYVGGEWSSAMATFNEYVRASKAKFGRASGENVTWMLRGEIRKEFVGRLAKAEARIEEKELNFAAPLNQEPPAGKSL